MARTKGTRSLMPADVNYKQRQARALEMRIEGYSQAEIAAQVGVSQSAVSRMLKKALHERTAQRVDDLRQLEYERGEALHRQMWQYAKKGNTGAAAVLTRLMDRRAKLLGLDPQRDGDGEGGGRINHDYFAYVMVYISEEAEKQLGELQRMAEMWGVNDPNPTFVGDLVVPADLAKQGEEGAFEAAKRAVVAVMPKPPVYMRTIVFHQNYRPVTRTHPYVERVDDEGRPLVDDTDDDSDAL